MRTVVTSHTMPLRATVGGDGISVQVSVTEVDDLTFELVVDYERDDQPTEAVGFDRQGLADAIRNVDPAWLRAQVDQVVATQGLSCDPHAVTLDVLAECIEGA